MLEAAEATTRLADAGLYRPPTWLSVLLQVLKLGN